MNDQSDVSSDDVERCHQDFYGSTDAELFTIVGDFEPKAITETLQQSLGDWKSPKPYQRIFDTLSDIKAIDLNLETQM